MGVYTLHNTIRYYDWGDTEWIPSLLGIKNSSDKPMAELWMGAHPSASSKVVLSDGETDINELITKDPKGILGKEVSDTFRNTLPFLFKVLAAGNPLSIQAHPNKKQAEKGFKRENDAGIPLDAYDRNYKDDNHKPELITALTEFHAMRGFRPLEDLSQEFQHLFSDISHPVYIPEPSSRNKKKELKRFFESILSISDKDVRSLVRHALSVIEGSERDDELRYVWMRKLNEKYPGDIGVLCPLFLNVLCLQPGEGMFLDAGELHAYLQGFGIEIMANSDNVLRGGCTSKYVAKDELLRVLRFKSGEPVILSPEPDSKGEAVFRTPTREFQLSVLTVNDRHEYAVVETKNVVILLCVEGSATVRPQIGSAHQLRKGQSVLITADTGYYSIEGNGRFFKATVGI